MYKRQAYTDSGKIVNLVSVEYNINDKSIEPQPAFGGIALRKDWLDAQGLEVPVTYDDWTKVLRSFKENYGCSQPLYIPSTGFWAIANFASGYGALNGMQNNDGTVTYGPMTEGWKKYVTLLNQWYEEGLVSSEYVANDPIGIDMAAILSSQTGATLHVYTMKAIIENGIGNGAELVAAQLPVEKAGEISQGGSNDGKVVSKKIYITTHLSDEKLPQVLAMLDYLYSYEGILLAGIGVEGDTYTLNEDDTYLLTDKILKNPDGISVSEAIDTFLCPANLQLVKDWSREYATITDSELAMCQTWDKDGNALILPALTLTSEENTRYSKILTDVDTYMKEMTNNFIMGAVSIDEQWDTYVDTLKGMGIDEAIAIQQAAYDRYILK